jgi:beta-galactosidase
MKTSHIRKKIQSLVLISSILFTSLFVTQTAMGQPEPDGLPIFGGMFIMGNESKEDIDKIFLKMKENGCTICRVYLHKKIADDYDRMDHAFKAAEKNGVRILATLNPDYPFPETKESLDKLAKYIEETVNRYKEFDSLYAWGIMNEPAARDNYMNRELDEEMFEEWKGKQETVPFFDKEEFLLDYHTWYLNWISTEVLKHDPDAHLRLNPLNLFTRVKEYNFPEWRKFLSSLGASIHASWFFDWYERDQYAVAMSAHCEILRSGAGDLPWMPTELQGGPNIFCGFQQMCTTPEEIAQWCWINVGSGSKGAIFFSINSFLGGGWGLLDYMNEPTDRLLAIGDVARSIESNPDLFRQARPVESGISILYTRDSMWTEKRLKDFFPDDPPRTYYDGSSTGGGMKSSLGYFEVLSDMGYQCNFKEISEYDFSKNDYAGKAIILAHQIRIDEAYSDKLQNFVSKGGKLIIDGLTAFHEQHPHRVDHWSGPNFILADLCGGRIKEFRVIDNLFEVGLDDPNLALPAHLWSAAIHNEGAEVIGTSGNLITATRNEYGKGEVVWIPSLVGLGSRLSQHNSSLREFLSIELNESLENVPIRFKTPQQELLLKTLKSGDTYVSVLINKGTSKKKLELINKGELSPSVLYANKAGSVDRRNRISISPEETIVIKWETK